MKKNIRTIGSAILAASLLCSSAGCAKQEESKESKPVQTKTTAESSKKDEKTGMFEGTLVSFSGKTLVLGKENKEYTFDLSNATVKAANMLVGDKIVVHYKGEITDKDGTAGVSVTEVEDQGGGAPQKPRETQIIGTLVRFTENSITIRINDGTELTFNANNCQHEYKNGLREGNWIVVTYIGEIQQTDTRNVKVVKITDNDSNVIEPEQKKMNIKALDETVYCTADGVNIRQSYTTDSQVLGVLRGGDSVQRTGVCENGWSRIIFNGADAYVYGDYLTTDAPKPDVQPVQPLQPEVKPQPEALQDEQKVTGTVVDVSMNTLTFHANDMDYTVYIADAVHQYKNGIQTGNEVEVAYTGDLNNIDSVTVLSVTDNAFNAPAQNAVYTGNILDATMNTVTLQLDDGVEMTFFTEGMTDNVGGLTIGTRVSVTADADSAASDSNLMSAIQMDLAE